MDNEKLNEVINTLYKKIEDGTMEQNSIELFSYMWLTELRDRRKQDKSVYETSKLFKNRDFIVLSKQDSDGDIREEETLELDQVIYSDYANEKVIEIDYNIDLIKSCDTTIEVTPVLIVEY